MGYCAVADVRKYIPFSIRVQGENTSPDLLDPNPESCTTEEIEDYIDEADQYINSSLSPIYDVPLRKINFGGTLSYPAPIPSISARIAAKFLWQRRMAGGNREGGDFIEKHYLEASYALDAIVMGHNRLQSQDAWRSKRFAGATWYDVSPSPVKEPPRERR